MILGLTGGIASGKSFCSDYLADHYGVHVVDADMLAREVVQAGSEGLASIVDAFGERVLCADGNLNRPLMREIMLAEPTARAQLNAIVHPRVRELMIHRLAEYHYDENAYQIMSVPLLLENGLEKYADAVVVIDVDLQTQMNRLRARDNADDAAIQRMIKIQMARQDRIARAHFVIDNAGSMSLTQRQLDELHHIMQAKIRAQ